MRPLFQKIRHCIALTLALLGLIPRVPAAESELHVLCWSEYVPASVVEPFEKRTGAKVVLDTFNTNDQMLAKLRAHPAFYDLIQPSGFYVEQLAQAGELATLDATHLPNLRHLDPKFRGLPHDPQNRYSVPWLSGTVGIVVDTARVKEPVRTWADVFNGRHAGRIVVVNDPREMVAWALASLKLPIDDVSDAALAKTKPVLERWLPQVAVFDSDSPKDALLKGTAEVGIVWSGEAAALWQQDHRFQFILPVEGAHQFVDSLAIPKGAPHQALAEDFINHSLDPAISVLLSAAYPYTNPNLTARRMLSKEQLANPASYPPVEPHWETLRNHGNTAETVNAFVARIRAALPVPKVP